MQTIWKFPLSVADVQSIKMPVRAEILIVAEQQGAACIWAKVETEAPVEVRVFHLVGTNHTMQNVHPNFSQKYIGTFQIDHGSLVFHLFEVVED